MFSKAYRVAELEVSYGVAFGTSGVRGLVTALTDKVCYGYVTGFLKYMIECSAWSEGDRVALGGDLRNSTGRILTACVQAVKDMKGHPIFCGYVPTPALAYWAFNEGVPAIMVTGSHIPDDRNGIKFYLPEGEILKADEAGIYRQKIEFEENLFNFRGMLLNRPELPQSIDIEKLYVSRYTDFFGLDALLGMRLGVYQHSAVGRDLTKSILTKLGAEVVALGRSDGFIPVDTEAIRDEDVALAQNWATQHRLDAIVSTDGDSDRPLLADEKGAWLRGDLLGIICGRALAVDSIITPVSSNSLLEKCGDFSKVYRTKIGSPYVIAKMKEVIESDKGSVLGFEANGGVLLGSDIVVGGKKLTALPTRDAMLPIIATLTAARKHGVSNLIQELPSIATFSERLQNFSKHSYENLILKLFGRTDDQLCLDMQKKLCSIAGARLSQIDFLDGFRMEFENDRVIHFRASGNAPELRCYTEAESSESAKKLNTDALCFVREIVS